jgi:transcriptional regulator with XRE-family HTH domain
MTHLRRTRELLGWGQAEFAKAVGTSQALISQIENGKRELTAARERQLQRMLSRHVTDERGERG